MNYTEYKHVEDVGELSILVSPVGGYWVVSTTCDGCPILRHSTRSIEAARSVAKLYNQIQEILHDDSQRSP